MTLAVKERLARLAATLAHGLRAREGRLRLQAAVRVSGPSMQCMLFADRPTESMRAVCTELLVFRAWRRLLPVPARRSPGFSPGACHSDARDVR